MPERLFQLLDKPSYRLGLTAGLILLAGIAWMLRAPGVAVRDQAGRKTIIVKIQGRLNVSHRLEERSLDHARFTFHFPEIPRDVTLLSKDLKPSSEGAFQCVVSMEVEDVPHVCVLSVEGPGVKRAATRPARVVGEPSEVELPPLTIVPPG